MRYPSFRRGKSFKNLLRVESEKVFQKIGKMRFAAIGVRPAFDG